MGDRGGCYNRPPFRPSSPNPVIFTLGINHHSAPLAIRERVAFGADKLPHALADLTHGRPVREAAILSTCNRTEIYCAAESPDVVIDWLVIGEPQILGQMKDAMRAAEENGTLGTQLHKLFQRAFSVAKEVRSTTAIGANIVSMAAAGVHLAERIFERISDQNILFIGAGEMIELCATHFAAQKPKQVTIANRTVERRQALADRLAADGIPTTAIRLDAL